MRAELADYGEVPAGGEGSHDCDRVIAPPARGEGKEVRLFCAIDHHGVPETGYPLSTRSITTIVAGRLHPPGEQALADERQRAGTETSRAAGGRRWGVEDRRRVAERFTAVEAVLDGMEAEAEAEAILAKVRIAMGDELGDDGRGCG